MNKLLKYRRPGKMVVSPDRRCLVMIAVGLVLLASRFEDYAFAASKNTVANRKESSTSAEKFKRAYDLSEKVTELTDTQKRRYDQALSLLRDAIILSSSNSELFAFSDKQKCLREIGFQDELEELNQIISVDRPSARYFGVRGMMSYFRGQYKDALEDFDREVKLGPLFELYYVDRALAFEKLGKTQESKDDLDHCIQIAPLRADAYIARVRILQEQGNIVGSRAVLNDYLRRAESKLQSNNPNILRAKEKLRQLAESKAVASITKNEDDVTHLQCMAQEIIDTKIHRYKDAIDLMTKAIELQPGDSLLYSERVTLWVCVR